MTADGDQYSEGEGFIDLTLAIDGSPGGCSACRTLRRLCLHNIALICMPCEFCPPGMPFLNHPTLCRGAGCDSSRQLCHPV